MAFWISTALACKISSAFSSNASAIFSKAAFLTVSVKLAAFRAAAFAAIKISRVVFISFLHREKPRIISRFTVYDIVQKGGRFTVRNDRIATRVFAKLCGFQLGFHTART